MPILDPLKLNEDYSSAKTAMKPFWDPFDEYERIARNRPHPRVVAAKLPTVTDGTLAGVIAAQPKRVVQQIPTGRVTSIDEPDVALMADFIWQNEIIPNANTNGDMIQKSWIMLSKALTYGYQYSYAFFKNSGDYFGADFAIPYIRDLIFERGKVYGPDCNKLFLRQWYTPADIQVIIDKETKLGRRAKSRGDTYVGSWDIPKLKRLLKQAEKAKDADALTPSEKEKSPDAKLIEIVHAFQVGVGAKFYSFAPDLPKGEDVVRTKVNPDPRGKMPINFLYASIDLSNPCGRGYVEMSGGMQNLLDSEVQAYQFMQKLMLGPPVMKWGDSIVGSTIKYKNNAVWDMGNSPTSKIEVVQLGTEAITNFANNYGLMKSQILSLTSNQDSSVSGTATGGAGQSKTAQGVKQQQQKIGFDDNYMRKQYEAWFQDNGESMLNIHFAESNGKREIELTEDFIDDVLPKMQQQTGPITVAAEKQQATIAYDNIKTKLKFRIDPTSSETPDDTDQVENLKELLADASASPYITYYLQNDGYQLHLGEAYRDLFSRLGVADIQKIVTKIPKGPDGQPQQAGSNIGSPAFDKPKVAIPLDKMPMAAQIQGLQNAGITVTPQDYQQDAAQQVQTDAASAGAKTAATAAATPPEPVAPAAEPKQQPQAKSQQPQQSAQPAQQPQLGPGDVELAKQFLQAGYSSQQALHAVLLMHHGYSHDAIMQALGAPQGGQ